MGNDPTQRWLDALGYSAREAELHRAPADIPLGHAYAPELRALLDPKGHIQAKAVFDVGGVPTVCFIDPTGKPDNWLDTVRQRVWNQNLVSIVLTVEDDRIVAQSPLAQVEESEIVRRSEASPTGLLSVPDIQSGDIWTRHTSWFEPEQRVDEHLLDNLGVMIDRLTQMEGLDLASAQFLLGQTLFVSYLEHRGIVGDVYRTRRSVGELHDLIRKRDRQGLKRLFDQLKVDFNGDFLDPAVARRAGWLKLGDGVFEHLDQFLSRVDLKTGQGSFWNYDFRFIPVELLSGIYETFLGEEKSELGAYYTPRHLANLVVDLAFEGRTAPAEETVFDGACGSGILLTTAFRRMLAYAQAQRGGRALSLAERIKLLQDRIYGGDISEPACRVTTFSLYLSLLEDLVPRDIALLTEDPDLKLPELLGHNIFAGRKEGDFFSPNNPLAEKRTYSILLSNPPWSEPSGSDGGLSYERWLKKAGRQTVRRQIAAAYAHRAANCVTADGRLVLILPISLLLAPTSERFIQDWLRYVQPERVVNFGDLRRQLFAKASHGCAVVVARPRTSEQIGQIPVEETFDYWTPKVDVSLAFGRLTLHTGDRHQVQSQAWWNDSLILRILAWGGKEDVALISNLQLKGRLGDLQKTHNWAFIKGFNRTRRGSPPLSPEPLAKMRYLDARKIPRNAPTLPKSVLERFPKEITSVVSYGSNDGRAFYGPRVLFPDGLSNELQMRAVFTRQRITFKHTVTAICGQKGDEDLLRFLAVYLRSGLASYFILHTAFSPANERERITVREVRELPFVHPDQHHDPDRAWKIVRAIAERSRAFQEQQDEALTAAWDDRDYDQPIAEYFGLTSKDLSLIQETVAWALPSRQQDDPACLLTPWQSAPTKKTVQAYTRALKKRLEHWRNVRGGEGDFDVVTHIGMRESRRGLGVVEIALKSRTKAQKQDVRDVGLKGIQAVIDKLTRDDLLPMAVGENLYLAADYLVIHGNSAFFIKPLVNRLWRPSYASRDARLLVEEATQGGRA